jgi:hypothetical protein
MHDSDMPKDAKPDRYVVDRIGTPDPGSSQYYVLDVVNDGFAREVLAMLGNKYRRNGREGKGQECFDFLHETYPAHAAVMEARNPPRKGRAKKGNGHL